jgi:hypothetical protein
VPRAPFPKRSRNFPHPSPGYRSRRWSSLLPSIVRGVGVGFARCGCEAFSSFSVASDIPAVRAECPAAVLAGRRLLSFPCDAFAFERGEAGCASFAASTACFLGIHSDRTFMRKFLCVPILQLIHARPSNCTRRSECRFAWTVLHTFLDDPSIGIAYIILSPAPSLSWDATHRRRRPPYAKFVV